MTVELRILAVLDEAGLPYQRVDHERATSAAQAALARGTPLSDGGKSLVMKLDTDIGFGILVVGGDRQIDNRALRKHLGIQRYRFATGDELAALTGLTPGCVPPFGHPVFDLPLFVDAQTSQRDRIVFAAGSDTVSIAMAVPDWLAVARPTKVFPFARQAG